MMQMYKWVCIISSPRMRANDQVAMKHENNQSPVSKQLDFYRDLNQTGI